MAADQLLLFESKKGVCHQTCMSLESVFNWLCYFSLTSSSSSLCPVGLASLVLLYVPLA